MTSSIVAAGAPRDGEFHSRRWAAVLLSILLPGLGHLYLGQPRRAIVVFIVLQAWVAALASLMVVAPTAPLRFALLVLLFAGALAVLIKRHILEAYRFPGEAMAPTILPGDFLMRDFQLIVNGVPAREPYPHAARGDGSLTAPEFEWQRRHLLGGADPAAYRPTYGTWGPLVVPDGAYFLLGDDRANSLDSRHRGFIPTEALVGRPVWIYFSRDPDTGTIRSRAK
ncbi:signal peptidase I [Gemmatimonas aurantiaca]|uniref:signal peptidase I n=1 Tax=Gemmatimonas aurantiaca TaxID=173480 RepID=UPI00301C9792